MELRPGYKKTDVGVIPLDWECIRISEIAVLESGHTPRRSIKTYWNGCVPWVSLDETEALNENYIFHTAITITQEGVDNSSARVLPAGTVVFSRTATIGKASILGREMATSQDFANYICGPRLFNLYLVYLFRAMGRTWTSVMAGSTHKTIYMPTFENLRIPVPPLPEQYALATALSDVDALLTGLDQLIAKKRDLKQAAMQQLLTGQTRLPGFCGAWETTRLRGLLVSPPDYGINAAAVPFSDKLPAYIRITDISEDGRFRPDPRVSVKSASADQFYLREGEIVFARTGASVGKSYLYDPRDGRLVFAGFLIRVRPNPKLLVPAFLAAYATTKPYWDWVSFMSMRSGQPGINGNEYAQMPLARPPLPEQAAIASALTDMDAELSALEARRDKTRALKQAMMQELLTGKTRLLPARSAHA